jgi:hypothetical protein
MGQWTALHNCSAKLTLSALAEVYLQDDISDDYCYDGYLTREFGAWSAVVSDEIRLDLSGDRKQAFFRNRFSPRSSGRPPKP